MSIREELAQLGEDKLPQLEAVVAQHVDPAFQRQFLDTVLESGQPFSDDWVRAITNFSMAMPGTSTACYYAVVGFFQGAGFKVRAQRPKKDGKPEPRKAVMITPAQAAAEEAERKKVIDALSEAGQAMVEAIEGADPNAPTATPEPAETESEEDKRLTPTEAVEAVFSYEGSDPFAGYLTLDEGSQRIRQQFEITVKPGRCYTLLRSLGLKKQKVLVFEKRDDPPTVHDTEVPSGFRLRRLAAWYEEQQLPVPAGVAAE